MIRRIFHILLLAVLLFPLASCAQSGGNNGEAVLSPEEFQQGIKDINSIQLVDVRTPGEYAEAHLHGALNLNYHADDFKSSLARLDKNKPVYVYCRVGGRSSKAARDLRQLGFTKVYDLKGGILAWEKQGLPTIR